MVRWVREHAVERLVPVAGEGARCRKCAALLADDAVHCIKCGLRLARAQRYAPGKAPWELAPTGQEADLAKSHELWDLLEASWEPAQIAAFVDFVKARDLLNHGIRKFQFRLVDHPGDALALGALASLAEGLQKRMVVATSQAEASAQSDAAEVFRLRKKLLVVSFAFWGSILLLFSALLWSNC